MRTTHAGMNISPAEYMAAMDDIIAALEHVGIDEETRKDVLAITWSLKGDIIHA
jgi:hemoglobin